MTLNRFLTFPVELLTADGRFVATGLDAPLWRGGFVVLARERCLFGRFTAPPGLSGRAAQAAAQVFAQTGAPFPQSGHVLLRQGLSFGVWWWDDQWVKAQFDDSGIDRRTAIRPEPLMYWPMEGWRIVKAENGYDAQLWRNDFLIADQWRRTPYDASAWADFVRIQGFEAEDAPRAPPAAHSQPLALNSPYAKLQRTDISTETLTGWGILGFATLMLCLTAYFGMETLNIRGRTSALEQKAQAIRSQSGPNQEARTQAAIRKLAAIKAVAERPDPLALLEHAQEIIAPFGYRIDAFSADHDKLRVGLPLEAVAGVDQIGSELAQSPYFTDVRPRVDRERRQLLIEMRARQVPPNSAGYAKVSKSAVMPPPHGLLAPPNEGPVSSAPNTVGGSPVTPAPVQPAPQYKIINRVPIDLGVSSSNANKGEISQTRRP